jgi:hypothetical protein
MVFNALDGTQTEEEIIVSDFEDGSSEDWSLNGNVSTDGILAIGQYSLRHAKGSSSETSVSTIGYVGVKVMMHLAASSLKKNDRCVAEVSTDSGKSWKSAVEVSKNQANSTFYSGELSLANADDNADLRLRFRAAGKGKSGGYCYGDEVVVMGIPFE